MEEGFQKQGIKKRPSRWWYLFPIFLNIIGGIVAYLLLEDRDKKFAKKLLIIGIVIAAVLAVLIFFVLPIISALYATGVFRLPRSGIAPCSPCFPPGSVVAYIDHNADTLILMVGPSEISNTKVIVGGTIVDGTPIINPPGSKITFTSTGLFKGDVPIILRYTETSTGLLGTVTAILHGAY